MTYYFLFSLAWFSDAALGGLCPNCHLGIILSSDKCEQFCSLHHSLLFHASDIELLTQLCRHTGGVLAFLQQNTSMRASLAACVQYSGACSCIPPLAQHICKIRSFLPLFIVLVFSGILLDTSNTRGYPPTQTFSGHSLEVF